MTPTAERYSMALTEKQTEIWFRGIGPEPARGCKEALKKYKRAVDLVAAWKHSAEHIGMLEHGDKNACRIMDDKQQVLWAPK